MSTEAVVQDLVTCGGEQQFLGGDVVLICVQTLPFFRPFDTMNVAIFAAYPAYIFTCKGEVCLALV